MAAEASEPEINGIDAAENTRRGDPSRNNGQTAGHPRVGYALRPAPCEASTATTPNILFYLVVCRSTRPRGSRVPTRPTPSLCRNRPVLITRT